MDLPQRIKGAKELAETLKTLVAMEREAYGLAVAGEGAVATPRKPVEMSDDDLAAIASARGS